MRMRMGRIYRSQTMASMSLRMIVSCCCSCAAHLFRADPCHSVSRMTYFEDDPMVRAMRILGLVIWAAGCSTPSGSNAVEACQHEGDGIAVSGVLMSDHGDWLRLESPQDRHGERILLVRDAWLQAQINHLQGHRLNLIVRPGPACGGTGQDVSAACIWAGPNAIAYEIVSWCGHRNQQENATPPASEGWR